jgi:hypothetical protein
MISGVLTTVNMSMVVSWVIIMYAFVDWYQYFKEMYCLHLQHHMGPQPRRLPPTSFNKITAFLEKEKCVSTHSGQWVNTFSGHM